MIVLYEENETLFESLGLGLLKDAKSCTVSETLNDSFDLELQYPITGANFSKITLNRIILAKSNPYSKAQPFRIYSISKPINGVITVRAFHISYDMNGIVVAPISGGTPKLAIDQIQNKAITEHSFKFYTDITENKSFKTNNYYNMRSLLMGSEQSVLETYKGEILFDKFNVYILKQRGSNKGASVRYAKNMRDLTHEVNYERLYNGVYPFYHQETTETTTTTTPDGFKQVFIVGHKPFQDGWLSYEADGEPYHPVDESPVQIATEGDYYEKVYCWNPTTQRYVEKVYNEMVNIIDCVTGLLTPSEKPNWIYIDVTALPKIVVKANADGYFKLATDDDWTKRNSGEVVFEGTVTTVQNNLIMYYSEVIPSDTTASEEETTTVTHIELKDKILWLDTPAAKAMKYDRILCLDLTSEFSGESPTEDELRTKANEYIEKNKIGQYKYDTKVSFIDLRSTTEGTKYEKMETIELGDFVKVTYEDLGVDVELRVVSTKYNVLLDRYDSIDLGEKSEKISASSVQTGDDVSSLTNDVGYTDVSTVNKLVAKMITAEYIKAKNAELSKAQIEELQTARIRCSGIIEATQFELDTLVAKMLTADNAVIKQTLEAGTVKVKGDITVTKGSISIENTESGTVFNVDRDGNVTANSVKITGGELNINDTFTVTPEGVLTALGADIRGRIEAESGLIASFTIESTESTEGKSNRLYSGTPGQAGSVLVSPGYSDTISNLDSANAHNWVFLAGNKFGVDDQGNLYSINAIISGRINANSGTIGGFTIASDKLYSDYVEISPTNLKYGQHSEFVLNSNGTMKIQNANPFNSLKWRTIYDALPYEQTIKYYPGDYCVSSGDLYICKEETLGTPSNPQAFNVLYWTKIDVSAYDEHSFYTVGDYCSREGYYYICTSPVGYQYIELTSQGLTASAIYVENATIHEGRIGGFIIGETALYKDISSFDAEGVVTGVYLGPDGIRIGKNLKIFPDGRIMSGSRDYDSNVIYHIGEYCIKQGTLYKCIVDATLGGLFDPNDWEEVPMRYFGIDDTGKLTASSAEIIGNITAETGYIGKPGEGFTITSKAIYNGFDDPDSTSVDEGVYLGTDGLRIGKNVSQQKVFTIGSLYNVDSIVKTIKDIVFIVNTYQDLQSYDTSNINLGQTVKVLEDSTHNNNVSYYTWNSFGGVYRWIYNGTKYTETNYIGSEFILSYDPVDYDRYISIREKQNNSTMEDSSDYIHYDDPYFETIRAKTIDGELDFEIKNDSYIYLNVNASSLYDDQGVFIGTSNTASFRLYYDSVSDASTSVSIEFFDTEEDWKNGSNPHLRASQFHLSTISTYLDFEIALDESPFFRLRITQGDDTIVRNCRIIQNTPVRVLLPANSSQISFTAIKYDYVRFKFIRAIGDHSSNPQVGNLKLTLKVLPGFLVTPDGFMHAYNAKIWGHFEGDVNIESGAIRITDGATKTFEVTKYGELTATSADITGTITATYITANDGGQIAGFTIDSNSIRTGTLGQADSVWMCKGSSTVADIGGSGNTYGWTFAAGSKFGVKTDGTLYASGVNISGIITATSGKIGPYTITSDYISTGPTSINSWSPVGLYLGKTDGLQYVSGFTEIRADYVKLLNPQTVHWATNGRVYSSYTGSCFRATQQTKEQLGWWFMDASYGSHGIFFTGHCESPDESETADWYYGTADILCNGILRLYATTYGYLEGSWISDGAINTSDRNKKHDIEYIDDRYDILFDKLNPVRFKYNNGTSNRYHTGLISQDVQEALIEANLTEKEFAAICTFKKKDENTGKVDEFSGLRYGEFIALNIQQIQKLKKRVAELEEIIKNKNN